MLAHSAPAALSLHAASAKAAEMADRWSWQFDRRAFWRDVTADAARRALLERQLAYFYQRSLGFLAAAVKGSEHARLEENVSQFLVRLGRLELWRTAPPAEEFVPLPSTEALANQLLTLAEVDLPAFAALLPLTFGYVWPAGEIVERLHAQAETESDLVRYLRVTNVANAILKGCDETEACVSDKALQRILVETMLMLETAELFAAEMLRANTAAGAAQE